MHIHVHKADSLELHTVTLFSHAVVTAPVILFWHILKFLSSLSVIQLPPLILQTLCTYFSVQQYIVHFILFLKPSSYTTITMPVKLRAYGIIVMCVVITFHMRHCRGEMYVGHARLCVCLFLAAFPHYCTDLDLSRWKCRWCPLVVHYWADLQSLHRFHCCDSIAPNVKCRRVLVLALCLVVVINTDDASYSWV